MIIEIDEVIVNKIEFEAAKNGDLSAGCSIIKYLDNLELYMHNISFDLENEVVVTLKELKELHLIDSVKINCFKPTL